MNIRFGALATVAGKMEAGKGLVAIATPARAGEYAVIGALKTVRDWPSMPRANSACVITPSWFWSRRSNIAVASSWCCRSCTSGACISSSEGDKDAQESGPTESSSSSGLRLLPLPVPSTAQATGTQRQSRMRSRIPPQLQKVPLSAAAIPGIIPLVLLVSLPASWAKAPASLSADAPRIRRPAAAVVDADRSAVGDPAATADCTIPTHW